MSRVLLVADTPLTLEVLSRDVQGEVAVRVVGCRPVLLEGEALYELSLERLHDDIVLPEPPVRPTMGRPSTDR